MFDVCPSCQVIVSQTDLECKQCGILFEKWKKRDDALHLGQMQRYKTKIDHATSSEFNWVVLMIVVAVVLLGFAWFNKYVAV